MTEGIHLHHSPHVTAQSGAVSMGRLGGAATFFRTAPVDDGRFGASLQERLKVEAVGAEKQTAKALPVAAQSVPVQAGGKDAADGVDKDQARTDGVVAHENKAQGKTETKRAVAHGEDAKGDSDKGSVTVCEDGDATQIAPVAVVQPVLANVVAVAVIPVADDAKFVGQKPEVVGAKVTGVGRGAAGSKVVDKSAHGATAMAYVDAPVVVAAMAVEPKALPMGQVVSHANAAVAAVDASKAGGVAAKPALASESTAPAAASSDMKTLVATPNVLEIGVASGQHGWVRVRAELDPAGAVATSLVAATTSAAEGLHKELPAISAYLAGEQVGFSSLVVNAADKSAGAGDAMQQGQRQDDGGSSRQFKGFGLPFEMDGSDVAGSLLPGAMLAAGNGFGTGSWLSVRV